MDEVRILFVCTGNICRSPTAEGVMRALLDRDDLGSKIAVDSAGISGWHTGEPPHRQSIASAADRGYDLSQLEARPIGIKDFSAFDFILALDSGHMSELQDMRPPGSRAELHMFLPSPEGDDKQDVPDPYGHNIAAFEHALDLIEQGCAHWMAIIRDRMTS